MLRFATIVLGITACYDPSFEDCNTACASDTECAPGHTCTGGLCASEGQTCDIEAPDIAGRYAMTLVNRDNGCAFPNWTAGTSSSVDVLMAKNADVITAEPQGLVAGFLDAWLGSHTWAGEQTADHVSLVLAGVKKAKQAKCEYTFDAAFDATLDGDVLRGNVTYLARTNGHPDCKELTGCTSIAEMTAIRAPD